MDNPVFFLPHHLLKHWHFVPSPPTPPIKARKCEFNPLSISSGQSMDTSLSVSLDKSNTYEFLLSVHDVLSTLQLNFEGEVVEPSTVEDCTKNDNVPSE